MTKGGNIPLWIGPKGNLKTWSTKTAIPEHLQDRAFKVNFGLSYGWVSKSTRGLVGTEGEVPICDFWLVTPGHVIGIRDRETASSRVWSREWRSAFDSYRGFETDTN